MRDTVAGMWTWFADRAFVVEGASGSIAIVPEQLRNFRLSLPWGRTFEAEIDFDLTVRH
jgi:hypothetical protein